MRFRRSITVLSVVIVALSAFAAVMGVLASGVFSAESLPHFTHTSVRGQEVQIWGFGVYRHMSVELAPQGIAQDVVTLTIGLPLLLGSLVFARRGSLRARLLLTGTLGYFMVTYVFYLVMGTFNELFLVYVVLAGAAFYAFTLAMMSFDAVVVADALRERAPRRFVGIFLILNSVAIALMWLGVVAPYAMTSETPPEVEHFTTLIVQGLDLSILLPASFLAGLLLLRKRAFGYLLSSVYIVFLAILMIALVGKIVGQTFVGAEVIPAIIIIPAICLTAVGAAVWMLRSVEQAPVGQESGG